MASPLNIRRPPVTGEATPPDAERLIAQRIDAMGGARAWAPIVLISLGGAFEFYDLMMTAYVSPGLVKAGLFKVGRAGLLGQSDQAAFASATFLGLFLGAAGLARLADRLGRRRTFTLAMLWYAGATAAMAGARSALELDAWRLIAGIGIGVELVTIDAYLGELAPARLRGRAFAVSQAIQFLAVPGVALTCWLLLPLSPLGIAGWRWVMILGAAGALGVWAIRAGLPESPRWLERQGRTDEALVALSRIDGLPAPPDVVQGPARPARAGGLGEAFSGPYRRRTAMLVIFNIAQAIGFYGFGNWAPTLIAAQGHEITRSLAYSAVIALAWPAGPLLWSPLADRFERKTLIIIAAAATAALGLAFAAQRAPAAIIGLGAALTLANTLLSFAYHAYQAELYPTRMRAAAVGFVYAWSRLSTVASSFVIAALLGAFGSTGVFVFIAGAMAVVIAVVGLAGPRTLGRSLETISD